jgi:hypothetical protein
MPFSAIRKYRASVVRALSSIALDKIAQVPIPTNPKSVLNNLLLAGFKNMTKPVEIKICVWSQWNDAATSSCSNKLIRTRIRTGDKWW